MKTNKEMAKEITAVVVEFSYLERTNQKMATAVVYTTVGVGQKFQKGPDKTWFNLKQVIRLEEDDYMFLLFGKEEMNCLRQLEAVFHENPDWWQEIKEYIWTFIRLMRINEIHLRTEDLTELFKLNNSREYSLEEELGEIISEFCNLPDVEIKIYP